MSHYSQQKQACKETALADYTLRLFYEGLPRQRTIVERDLPDGTVIALLGENLAAAIEYYRSKLRVLPAFTVIDSTSSGGFMWQALADRESIVLLPFEDFINTPERLCLFARPMQTQYGSGCLYPTVEALAAKGLRKGYLLDRVAFKYIPERPPETGYFDAHIRAIQRIWAALADEESRLTYLAAVKALVTGDMGYLPLSPYRQYHHPIVRAEYGDVVYEGGVYDGKTTLEFAALVGPSGHVHAFEPVPGNYESSHAVCGQYGNITLNSSGLWKEKAVMRIRCEAASSRIVSQEDDAGDSVSCPLVSLDSYAASSNLRCDLLKLDVEGAELEVLEGAVHTLQMHRPKLHISIYHAPWSQLIAIPAWIMKHLPGYRFFVGHHSAWFPETMLYGIPEKTKNECRVRRQ